MPTLRQDSLINEYVFTKEESILARTLSPNQVAWLHTKYANTLKEKATKIVPISNDLDRDYLLLLGSLEGRLEFIQELLNEHTEAQKERLNPESAPIDPLTDLQAIDTVANRAANLVHEEPKQ